MRALATWMPASLLTVAAAIGLAACGGGASVDELATLDGEGFTVQMPGKPDRSVNPVTTGAGRVQVIAYIVELRSTAYSVAYTELPAGVRGDLDGALSSAAAKLGGTVASREKATHQGFPARDARITGAKDRNGNEGTVFSRVIIAKGRLWHLQFVGAGRSVTSPGDVYPRVRDSLRIE